MITTTTVVQRMSNTHDSGPKMKKILLQKHIMEMLQYLLFTCNLTLVCRIRFVQAKVPASMWGPKINKCSKEEKQFLFFLLRTSYENGVNPHCDMQLKL